MPKDLSKLPPLLRAREEARAAESAAFKKYVETTTRSTDPGEIQAARHAHIAARDATRAACAAWDAQRFAPACVPPNSQTHQNYPPSFLTLE